MHGLMLRPVQCFVRDAYGPECWLEIAARAGVAGCDVEPMSRYDRALAARLIEEAAEVLDKPAAEFMEDLGTYLVSHPNCETVRRLLRFGGDTFLEFLYSLTDLPARARLAVSDLELPQIDLKEHFSGSLTLILTGGPPGAGDVAAGLLRAMADDYGALVILENLGANGDAYVIDIQLMDLCYAEGRAFQLAGPG